MSSCTILIFCFGEILLSAMIFHTPPGVTDDLLCCCGCYWWSCLLVLVTWWLS